MANSCRRRDKLVFFIYISYILYIYLYTADCYIWDDRLETGFLVFETLSSIIHGRVQKCRVASLQKEYDLVGDGDEDDVGDEDDDDDTDDDDDDDEKHMLKSV